MSESRAVATRTCHAQHPGGALDPTHLQAHHVGHGQFALHGAYHFFEFTREDLNVQSLVGQQALEPPVLLLQILSRLASLCSMPSVLARFQR